MRIDGTSGPQQPLPRGEPSLPKPARPLPAGAQPAEKDAQIRAADSSYVQKAMAGEGIDRAAVAEARRLLEAGQLDTPEAARRAAEAILDRGP